MLVAESLGVSSIAMASTAAYPELVRQHFRISEDRVIVCGIAFGFERADDPVNRFRTERAPPDELTDWID